MRPSFLPWTAALFLLALAPLACNTSVSVEETDPDPDPDPGCAEPAPDVPSGGFCPPIYECINGEWLDTGGACPEPECPSTKPADGSACAMVGQSCPYEEDIPCGPLAQVDVVCTDGGWLAMYNYCSPEPECPEELPVVGADCSGWDYAYSCNYFIETQCGEQMFFVSCSYPEGGSPVWAANSTSTCEICKGHDTPAECALAPECQWLVPGCGETPVEMGCYPKQGCDVSDCPTDDSICVETTYDPCAGSNCNACGASYFACLPAWAP